MSNNGVVKGICISEKRGIAKTPINEINLIEDFGLAGDAHGGNWHRQVSILSLEEIEKFKERGATVELGAFGENLVVSGIELKDYPIGTKFKLGSAILETTQIGKKCHHHCNIFKQIGDCIMPRVGVFAKVINSGLVKLNDPLEIIKIPPYKFTAAIVTLSDKGSKGERVDLSGAAIKNILSNHNYKICATTILPDEQKLIENELIRLSDDLKVNLIITTGGTGFSPRDVTPEATLAVATKNAFGIAEYIRYESFKLTKRAMLSRAVSVIRNQTLIINLPGSEKAVNECLEFIIESLDHGLNILLGEEKECGQKI